MSMYRQLWLALILSTALALIGGFLASTLSARTYLEEQLRLKNNDTATALALSLSRGGVDTIEMELATAALFDSGYFQSIRIVGPRGEMLVERTAGDLDAGAPAWFIHTLPISAPAGQASISDGWKQLGTVQVTSQHAFVYRTLWSSTQQLALALLLAGLVGAYLSTLILRRIKKPLDKVVEQARAISDRRFLTTPEPKVPELRQLVAAMNSSVMRLKSMFDEETVRLDQLKREANHDALTGLLNRTRFMAGLKAFLDVDEGHRGHLLLIRIAHLADINRKLGRESTDALLQRIGTTIDHFCAPLPGALSARLNGADFAIMLPDAWDARTKADELLQQLVATASVYVPDQAIAFIGIGSFQQGEMLGTLLERVDHALAKVEATNTNGIHESTTVGMESLPSNAEEWSKTLNEAIQHGRTKLALFPVLDNHNQVVHRESALRIQISDGVEWLPAGRFLWIAERLGMTGVLDLIAVRHGLEELARDQALPGLAINLSGESLHDATFLQNIKALLHKHPLASQRLLLEIPEYGVLAHLAAFRRFCSDIAQHGCRVGIEHFGRQFSQIGKLHELEFHYLKVDASFIRELDTNASNHAFLKGMINIVHLIDLQIFAEGVSTEAELSILRTLDFDGATGPAVR
ncbi:EAL domain-containing protein [uncultured Oxalicibacterium sp.]|uniref:bifunctional diguanylate cyclase/phosphodiesterase n=1 Tax=uncultured Oxalicibacterium sp. TaxID=1168540 RepID=UPI0025EA045F|nr:EAL domain-containing protein [uncultured Oxalicibacterium sp.]